MRKAEVLLEFPLFSVLHDEGGTMIKLIASDIDGTLLPEGTSDLNPEYFKAIRELKKKGIRFAAVSGRNYNSAAKLFEPVLEDIYLIVQNGGWILEGSRTIYARTFRQETILGITDAVEKMTGMSSYIGHAKEGIYVYAKDPSIITMMREGYHNICFPLDSIQDFRNLETSFFEMSVYIEKDPRKAELPFSRETAREVSYAVAGSHWIDMMPEGTSKGEALRWLYDHTGIRKEETIACGDNDNDLPLLLAAGDSYCVEEAVEEVKKAAGHVAGSMYEDAILKLMWELPKM